MVVDTCNNAGMATTSPTVTGYHWFQVLDRLLVEMRVPTAELAAALGVARQTPWFWVRGQKTGVGIDRLNEIADRLGVDVRLFHGSPIEAVQWLVEHRPEVYEPGYRAEFLLPRKVVTRNRLPGGPHPEGPG